MKNIFIFLLFLFPFYSNAEFYKCDQLKGFEIGLKSDKPTETETTDKNGCDYIIEKETAFIYCDNKKQSECVVFQNNEDKIDFFCAGVFASGYYTIIKKDNFIRYVKNGFLGKSYSMMMYGKCKK